MLVNADLARRAVVSPGEQQWVPSPQHGVERVMLDRFGAEHGRATSLVRYAPGSTFPAHRHPGGEEILVLRGTFCEYESAYPAGWYLRNPPGSAHLPSSPEGAVIFVKLGQMSPAETVPVRIDTRDPANWSHEDGRAVCRLFRRESEQTCLLLLEPGMPVGERHAEGIEVLVMAGSVVEPGCRHERGTWMRVPDDADARMHAGAQGATIYLKTGHLKKR